MKAEETDIDNNTNIENLENVENNGDFAQQESPEEITDASEVTDDARKAIELTEEITRLNDLILRERAEFINYRKRSSQESLAAEGRIAGKILQEIVSVFDAFDQLFSSGHSGPQAMEKFLEGSKLIRKQLWQVFENLGVEEIDPADQEFNPQTMEALSVTESTETVVDMVKQVYQKGYKFKEKVLRPARVAVEKPKAQ